MQYATYNRSLHYELSKIGIELIDKYENLNEEQKIFVDNYFDKNIEPVVSHIAIDMSSPFPLIPNKNLNIALLLKRKKSNLQKYNYGKFFFGNVGVPSGLKRFTCSIAAICVEFMVRTFLFYGFAPRNAFP